MKRLLLTAILLVAAVICCTAQKVKNVTVTNADEFIKAIASNTNITLKTNGTLAITSALDKLDASRDISDKEVEEYGKLASGVYFTEEYDGRSIVVINVNNLSITGDAKRTHIQAKPSYSNVLYFNNCKDITIKNIKAGHVAAGSCTGDVISFEKCDKINIDNCDLYGCGVIGISMYETENVAVSNTEIRECSDEMVRMHQCYGVTFTKCYMHDCGTAINNWASTGIEYNDCKIIGEDGTDLYDFYRENPDFVDGDGDYVDDSYFEDEDKYAALLETADRAYDELAKMLGEEFVNGVIIEDLGDEAGMAVFPENNKKFAAVLAPYDYEAGEFSLVFLDIVDTGKGEKMFFGNGHIIVVKQEGIFSYEIKDGKLESVTQANPTSDDKMIYRHGNTKSSMKQCTEQVAKPHFEFEATNIENAQETDEEYPWG